MILHIIKKDLRLLWPLVAGLTALNALAQWMRYGWSVLGNPTGFPIFGPLSAIGWIVVVAILVHQDVIPGERQDWLTRPIKRRDLVAAKLSFVGGLLHLPLFVMMMVEVLAAGYALPEAAAAALASTIAIFAIITLPTLVLAAVTRNFVETLIAALVVSVVAEVAMQILNGVANASCGATCGTSLSWVGGIGSMAVVVTAGLAVIALQYFKPGSTSRARALLLVAAVGFALAGHVSWPMAFAIQRVATGAPGAPASVTFSLERNQPRVPRVPQSSQMLAARGALAGLEPGALLDNFVSRHIAGTTVSLPIRVTGQRAGTVLWADRVEVRLVDGTGRVVYRGDGGALEVRAGSTGVAQTVLIPSHVFDAHAASELRVELDYWLTELEANAAATVPADGGAARLASGEQCSARGAGSGVRLSCLTIHPRPACYSAAYDGTDLLVCAPRYWPDALWGNLFARFELELPLAGGRPLHVATYEPRDHFTTRLVASPLRLGDFVAESLR
jgi:hypothetical protein